MTSSDNNSTLYNDTLLNARVNSNFITIPQTTVDYEQLHKKLTEYSQTKYCITKLEKHKDEGLHIHVVIRFKQQIKIKQIHNIIMAMPGHICGSINYQKPIKFNACLQYLKKELTEVEGKPYLEYGDTPLDIGQQAKRSGSGLTDREQINKNYSQALVLAQEGQTDEAIEIIKRQEPRDAILYGNKIKESLAANNETKLRYNLPEAPPLEPAQQRVWDLLQEQPKKRRIIWVTGHYGSGKSTLYSYIKLKHPYEMYDAGQSCKMEDVVYGYNEEGVIGWDLPKTFNFETMGDTLCSIIEKFSDFGQTITSKKYAGKTCRVRGHVVVFSNKKCPDNLRHRDVIDIELPKREGDTLAIDEKIDNVVISRKKPHQFSSSDSDSDEDEVDWRLGNRILEYKDKPYWRPLGAGT